MPTIKPFVTRHPVPVYFAMTFAIFLGCGTRLREFRSRLLKWQVGACWYAVALLTAPILMTATP